MLLLMLNLSIPVVIDDDDDGSTVKVNIYVPLSTVNYVADIDRVTRSVKESTIPIMISSLMTVVLM